MLMKKYLILAWELIIKIQLERFCTKLSGFVGFWMLLHATF